MTKEQGQKLDALAQEVRKSREALLDAQRQVERAQVVRRDAEERERAATEALRWAVAELVDPSPTHTPPMPPAVAETFCRLGLGPKGAESC